MRTGGRIVGLAVLLWIVSQVISWAAMSIVHDEENKVKTQIADRTISVTGFGQASSMPDVADVTLTVNTHATTAQEAMDSNTTNTTAIHTLLKERGIVAKDIHSVAVTVRPPYSQASVSPVYASPGSPNPYVSGGPHPNVSSPQGEENAVTSRAILPVERPGEFGQAYHVQNRVTVTLRDVSKVGAILDAAAKSNAIRIERVLFRLGEPEKLLESARKQAMANARSKADNLAGQLGVLVGQPISIKEEVGGGFSPYSP